MRYQSRLHDPITDLVTPRRELLIGNDGLIEAVKPSCFVSVSHHENPPPSRMYVFYQIRAGTRQESVDCWRLTLGSCVRLDRAEVSAMALVDDDLAVDTRLLRLPGLSRWACGPRIVMKPRVAHASACRCRLQPTVPQQARGSGARRTEVRRGTLKRAPRGGFSTVRHPIHLSEKTKTIPGRYAGASPINSATLRRSAWLNSPRASSFMPAVEIGSPIRTVTACGRT